MANDCVGDGASEELGENGTAENGILRDETLGEDVDKGPNVADNVGVHWK